MKESLKKKGYITKKEGPEIEILLSKKYKQKDIAKVVQRSESSISDEIKRNSVNGIYIAKSGP